MKAKRIWLPFVLLIVCVLIGIFVGKRGENADEYSLSYSGAADVRASLEKQLEASRAPAEPVDMSTGEIIAEFLYARAEYTLISGDSSCGVFRVTAPDIAGVFRNVRAAGVDGSMEAVLDAVLSELSAGNFTERTVEVEVPTEAGKAVLTSEFVDALYGGLLSMQQELLEEYTGGGEGQ